MTTVATVTSSCFSPTECTGFLAPIRDRVANQQGTEINPVKDYAQASVKMRKSCSEAKTKPSGNLIAVINNRQATDIRVQLNIAPKVAG